MHNSPMKVLAITVAVALVILAATWALVRADLLAASALRFLPAILAIVAAGGIACAVIQRKQDAKLPSPSRSKKK